MKKYIPALLVLSLMLILSGCADVETSTVECLKGHEYGFWGGLWHGVIAPFAFIGSLIWDDIAVYAVNNNGGWYDLGFLIGVGAFVSSSKK